jgi:nucleotide sugar dehydrogenase
MMKNLDRLCFNIDATIRDVMNVFEHAHSLHLPSGIALVVDEKQVLIGTVTEGDIRRAFLAGHTLDTSLSVIYQNDPIFFEDNNDISQILEELPNELAKRNRKSSKYLNKIVLVDKDKHPARVLEYHQLWEQRVGSHRHIVIIGLGYVGLTMALAMADAGFLVTGVEVDPTKIAQLEAGHSYIHEIGLPELLRENLGKNYRVSASIPEDGDEFIISVGTPVKPDPNGGNPKPTMMYLEDSVKKISSTLKRGNLVILRSTVPVGTSRNVVMKGLEAGTGLRCGIDFNLAFCPERTAEGKALKELRSLPQIVGGFNKDATDAAAAIFRDLTPTIVKLDSLEAAEMAKLINNTFRDYIFAYSNQVAKIAHKFNINIMDVIRAANEGYPRDPVPLPSPGVGGPCLTKDPFIFSSISFHEGHNEYLGEIFERGRYINQSMHEFVLNSVLNELKFVGKDPKKCNILVCGLAFKGHPETGDIRNSTSVEIAQLFMGQVNKVYGYDPVALEDEIREYAIEPVIIPNGFKDMDAILFLNNHKNFEKIDLFAMTRSMASNPIVYDGWGILHADDVTSAREAVYLGLSYRKSSLSIG